MFKKYYIYILCNNLTIILTVDKIAARHWKRKRGRDMKFTNTPPPTLKNNIKIYWNKIKIVSIHAMLSIWTSFTIWYCPRLFSEVKILKSKEGNIVSFPVFKFPSSDSGEGTRNINRYALHCQRQWKISKLLIWVGCRICH